MSAATNESIQEYTVSQTGSVLGSSYVTRSQNQVSPQLETPILAFECPDKFDWIELVTDRHPTKFIPRTMETISGDGATTTFAVSTPLQSVNGETDLAEQVFPTIRAVEVGGSELTIDSVDYAANEITFAAAPPNGADNVKLYPTVSDGTLKYRGVNQFGQVEGVISDWGTPVYRFLDFDQNKRGTEVTMHGSIRFGQYEKLELVFDSDTQIVWTDDDYPDSYVSTFEQKVDIKL